MGVGLATGRIIIHNIRMDETLMSFTQEWGPVTTLAFRTGADMFILNERSSDNVPLVVMVLRAPDRWSSHHGVQQPSGSHGLLGSGAPPAGHSTETRTQDSCCRGNLPARRAAAGHQWSRQRDQGQRQQHMYDNGCLSVHGRQRNTAKPVWFHSGFSSRKRPVMPLIFYQVWIFDQEGGGARLLRCRQGHSAPPTTIRHHGHDGKNILSAGD